MNKNQENKGWYHRGYLPHADFPNNYQVITYRLADSLPESARVQIGEELRHIDSSNRDIEQRKQLEAWLDAGLGSCVLQEPQAASCIIENWHWFAGKRYDLIAWVIMPNHVHVLIRAYKGITLSKIVQSWKSYTSRRILTMFSCENHQKYPDESTSSTRFCRAGARRSQDHPNRRLWMRDYWDRFIRDEKHLNAVIEYIHANPVKAGLVDHEEDWPWSSASEWRKKSNMDST